MMTRRASVMALFAIIGQLLRDDAEAKQTISNADEWKQPKDLTVHLGGMGFERFHFVDGIDKVTFTAKELMAALKELK